MTLEEPYILVHLFIRCDGGPRAQDPGGQLPISPEQALTQYGIHENGAVVHLAIDPNAEALVAGPSLVTKKKIAADGSIVAVQYEESQKDLGFRPGMPRLRDLKKSWTLTDFLEMDEDVCIFGECE